MSLEERIQALEEKIQRLVFWFCVYVISIALINWIDIIVRIFNSI